MFILKNTSKNFQFSSAVAGFALLLKNSDYKENLTFEKVEEIAKKAKGNGEKEYRAEFIQLIKLATYLQ